MAFLAAVPILAAISGGATIASGIAGTFGAISEGQAKGDSDRFNAQVSNQNAAVATENAAIAGQAGSEQAAQQSQKTRAEVGSIKTNQAAGGVDVNSGSAVDTQVSARELGDLDALTIRSNATKEAYGYVNQANNFKAQANLDESEARNDVTSGWLNGATTLLGTVSGAADKFGQLQAAGGLG